MVEILITFPLIFDFEYKLILLAAWKTEHFNLCPLLKRTSDYGKWDLKILMHFG